MHRLIDGMEATLLAAGHQPRLQSSIDFGLITARWIFR